jgi:hypothetical protein
MESIDKDAFARIGAAARLAELEAEATAIRRAFPGIRAAGAENLFLRGRGRRASADGGMVSSGRKRKRKPMSAAMKREVSRRMKKYWAARRAANAKHA